MIERCAWVDAATGKGVIDATGEAIAGGSLAEACGLAVAAGLKSIYLTGAKVWDGHETAGAWLRSPEMQSAWSNRGSRTDERRTTVRLSHKEGKKNLTLY